MTLKNSLIKIIKEKRLLLETVFNETAKRLKISKPRFTEKEAQKLIKKIEGVPAKNLIFIKKMVENIIKPPMKGGQPLQRPTTNPSRSPKAPPSANNVTVSPTKEVPKVAA